MAITVTTNGSTSVTVTAPTSSSLVVTEKGVKGDTGADGANGADGTNGTNGADGVDLTAELNAEITQRGLGDALNQNSISALNGQLANVRSTLNVGTTGDDLSDINAPASDDKVLIQDTSDSNNLKYVDFGDFASGSLSNISEDTSPQLGANLDVQARSLFTSTSNGDIQFTPNGTGSVNLDGTVKFKRFASGSAPDPFEGGMYADDNDELYFGVS